MFIDTHRVQTDDVDDVFVGLGSDGGSQFIDDTTEIGAMEWYYRQRKSTKAHQQRHCGSGGREVNVGYMVCFLRGYRIWYMVLSKIFNRVDYMVMRGVKGAIIITYGVLIGRVMWL